MLQFGDVIFFNVDFNSMQFFLFQKEECDRIVEVENGISDECEEQVSGLYENFYEQLERKKVLLGMLCDCGNDGDLLDFERW